MSSRKIRHGGSMVSWSSFFSRTKKYKYNKSGNLEEITASNTLGDDEFKVSGSKSSLRRMADLERNVSLLITKFNTLDGDTGDGDEDNFDSIVNKSTLFKKHVYLGNGSSDNIVVRGELHIDGPVDFGSSMNEAIMDVVGGMVSGNTESGITVTYDDSSNEFDFDITSAPKWETARTLSLAGDVSGSVSIDGSANVSITTTVANDSHTHDTRYYTKAEVDSEISTAVAGVVDSAPGALNTLNELAAALGDDANFASSVTSSLAGKVATNSAQALRATDAITVSNDTITIHKADGTSESVTTTDANSDTYLTGASFNTSNGVLTLTRNSGSVTVDLDGRYTDNGYADTMNQHVRTTDSPTFVQVNAIATSAKYADLAERYAADAPYAEGTVVVFGGEAEVTASTSYAQRSVAGVVSTKPAVMMNAEAGNSQTHPYIALQGRVPVKVTGEVKKGDILVASDIAGTATAWDNDNADPRMTAYVGIAISDAVDGFVEVKVGK